MPHHVSTRKPRSTNPKAYEVIGEGLEGESGEDACVVIVSNSIKDAKETFKQIAVEYELSGDIYDVYPILNTPIIYLWPGSSPEDEENEEDKWSWEDLNTSELGLWGDGVRITLDSHFYQVECEGWHNNAIMVVVADNPEDLTTYVNKVMQEYKLGGEKSTFDYKEISADEVADETFFNGVDHE